MSSFVGSIALIRDEPATSPRWLMRQDNAGHLAFIESQLLIGDSFREAIMRDVGWTLNLCPGKDFLVSSLSRLRLNSQIFVPSEDEEVHFVVEFFVVDLFKKAAREAVMNDPANVCVSGAEAHQGVTESGIQILERHALLIAESEVISTW